ncbi:MAG: DUF5060 domain-containing protein [Armatimonadetes bacterium]|nr:DUF5060 domain-containing protein [Armatimonadota bacterium]
MMKKTDTLPLLTFLVVTLSLVGCGGAQQDYGGFSRSINGDIGSGYNNSIANNYGGNREGGTTAVSRGSYAKIEGSFQLKDVKGDPFDFEQNAVVVTLKKSDGGKVDIPAFYDGNNNWKVRYTPMGTGKISVEKVKHNNEIAHEERLEPKDWTVSGEPEAGFVRIDKGDKSRFIFDNGSRYYPLGHNVAWKSNNQPDVPEILKKMGSSGENWARIWMNHWDGKNLDWSADKAKKIAPGQIDLDTAKKWDSIVEAAGKSSIYFQLTLQHHGQFSSQKGYKYSNNNNANWEDNPWNVKNGGFLQNPEDFFTDIKARKLTKRKLYYIMARWGYSPNILAWELFNEVEGTDAGSGKQWQDIAMWHREMSLFLRQFDGYHHLITTSARPGVPADSPIWETVDYTQTHIYPSDILSSLLTQPTTEIGKKLEKPHFIGEFGESNLSDTEGHVLHKGLWASIMNSPTGSAMYWDWDAVEKGNRYGEFQQVRNFLDASSLPNQGDLVSAQLPMESSQKADLRFAPGEGWTTAKQNEFVVSSSGVVSGIQSFPSFLQGAAHREMTPKPLTLQVSYASAGKVEVKIGQVSAVGGTVVVKCAGKETTKEFTKDTTAEEKALTLDVPAGAQTITIENPGKDWVVIRQIVLVNYAPALADYARIGKEYAAAWLYHRGNLDSKGEVASTTGRINLMGLKKGKYKATWWDVTGGKSIDNADLTVDKEKEALWLSTPPIARDVALYVVREGRTDSKKKGKNSENARGAGRDKQGAK